MYPNLLGVKQCRPERPTGIVIHENRDSNLEIEHIYEIEGHISFLGFRV